MRCFSDSAQPHLTRPQSPPDALVPEYAAPVTIILMAQLPHTADSSQIHGCAAIGSQTIHERERLPCDSILEVSICRPNDPAAGSDLRSGGFKGPLRRHGL